MKPTSLIDSVFSPNGRAGEVFVIAEIGKNFIETEEERPLREYIDNAIRLIDAAAKAGADAVKFQTHVVEDEQLDIHVVSPHFPMRDRIRWLQRVMSATPLHFWHAVKKRAIEKGLQFLSTPMSRKAAQRLHSVGVPFWKVGSGDATDFVLLDYITETGKPIVLSSGMVSFTELDRTVDYLRSRQSRFALLYCVSEYPAPAKSFNLATIEYMRDRYPGVSIGFSDHSVGENAIALGAVKLGARVIEKHFSFSRELWGADHKVSMTPSEMAELVAGIRSGAWRIVDGVQYYGSRERELSGANSKFRPYFHKTLVAARAIPEGTVLGKDMLYAMRPFMHSNGLSAAAFHSILGKRIRRAHRRYEPITVESIE